MDHYRLFIDGEFVDAHDGATFESFDPGTEAPIATVAKAGKLDAEAAIAAARRAFERGDWSRLSPAARASKVYDFADQIGQQSLRMGVTEAMDSGQVIGLARFWAFQGSQFLRNMAYHAANGFPWEEDIPYPGNVFAPGREFIRREPIGVCVGIIPWNFPAMMAFWKIGQSIVMGNTVVLKPASATPLSAAIVAEAANAAGIPPGVINVLNGPGAELGEVLCTHPEVDKVAFTGSTAVGRDIMRMASDTVKKVTLELGGKSANIILDDADLDLAVEGAVFGTFFHQGQVCESGTRVLVASKIRDEFLEKMARRAETLRVGYQLDPRSQLGPLVSGAQLETVEGYVSLGQEEGAELVTGGTRVEVEGIDGGFYYAPTIFAGVDNKMRIAQEEIFGPVVCVETFDSDEEAAAIANDSMYGLAGGVFSTSTARAERLAREMRTGTVWINNFHIFADFAPFGGYKQSGVGRELGASGLAEYTQIKRIHVNSRPSRDSNFVWKLFSDDKRVSGGEFVAPTKVISGHGSLAAIYEEVVRLGCRRALILTDGGLAGTGLVEFVQDALVDFGVGVFDQIPPDSGFAAIDAATAKARELDADCIVSVGGGSVIDTGKAVAVTLKNGGSANDHVALMRLREPQTPHIAVPTTAGTGSEVTNASVISSDTAGRKVYIVDSFITPNTAILDPRFTLGLPPALTVGTAMDAMTHAVEALTSTRAQPACDGLALQAIRLLRANLPLVMADGSDEAARLNVAIAATLAGHAFTIAQVGLVHSMSHTMGTLHHVHHGTACGIFLPKVMRFNVDYAAPKLAMVADALGVSTADMNERDAALAAADEMEALMMSVGHPTTLRELGIPDGDFTIAAMHAAADSATLFNARPLTGLQEVVELFHEAY